MFNSSKSVIKAIALCIAIIGLSACQKEGPAERAGKEIDSTVEKAGQKIEQAGEKIQDAAKDKKQ
ncbi:MAG: hypothetical protein IV084_05635 [Rugosibacter sp.]|jgi:hypothetical protein|nr:hypothetical protein [Rugosibacter sp.]